MQSQPMVTKTCEWCKNPFQVKASFAHKRRFCCPSCSSKHTYAMREEKPYHPRVKENPAPSPEVLHRLYVDERKSVRQIAKELGFASKTSIQNFLRGYGIERRPATSGLVHHGIEPPDRDTLYRLVHVEHMGYREIGKLYGISGTALMQWMRKYQIEAPEVWTTRRKGVQVIYPTQEELRKMYLDDQMTLAQIAEKCGVSQTPIADLCKKYGIPIRPDGFNGGIRFTCDDGHLVRSTYEQKVDNWLHEHGIAHEYEPQLPCDKRYKADFLANGWYIEVWGVNNSKSYAQRKSHKISLYHAHQYPLIQLSIDSFQPRRKDGWKRSLSRLLP